MMKLIKQHWLLLLAIIVGFALRFYKLENLPVILNRDEAALAYNAYLLSETGRDEWGRVWPLALESFGDYKLPGYSWILIPFFKVFGLSDLIVRLPSALAGTLLILVFYLWLKALKITEKFSLVGAWLIALLPVSIFYSRMAYEANIALTLMVTALWLITLLTQKWQVKLVISLILVLTLAVFTYNTPWLLLPFLLVYLYLIYPTKPKKRNSEAWWLMASVAVIFIITTRVFISLTGQKSGIAIFTDETIWSNWIAYRESLHPNWLWLLGNKYVYWLGLMWTRFWQSFSPYFLVIHGDNHAWHRLPTWGHLTFLVYGFGWLGIILTIKQLWQIGWKKILKFKDLTETTRFNLANIFLFIATLGPSVITVDSPHATRSLLFFIFWVMLAVKGMSWLFDQSFWPSKKIFWLMFSLLIWIETLWHLQQLFIIYPKHQLTFMPGFNDMIQLIEKQNPQKTAVAIVDPDGYQYILLAWYLKIPAEEYFATNIRQLPDKIGFRYGQQVTNYHFIAKSGDRVPAEKILLEWRINGWRLTGL
ncbi:MAG: glycosyltransferase family 39 protein [Candidatus Pacebacteria bacterium]|nr:glycosyltransferase family 39 protein [Candidatus Paceibacterota bacterium]